MEKSEAIKIILSERDKQLDLPGTEFDLLKDPNDWIAIASHYLTANATRSGSKPSRIDYQDNLVKAAAVILAALEHIEKMQEKDKLT